MKWYDKVYLTLIGFVLPVGLAFYTGSWVVIPVWYLVLWAMSVANF